MFMVNNQPITRTKSGQKHNHAVFPANYELNPASTGHARGMSMDNASKFGGTKSMMTRHGNMMLKSHNEGMNTFTKGASLPQHPNSTTNNT